MITGKKIWAVAVLAAAMILAVPAGELEAQASGRVGTLLIAHGANAEWNAQVETIAAEVDTGGPIEVSYLMGAAVPQHRFQDAAARLVEQGAEQIVVVPMLVSSHSSHYDQIGYLAGEVPELTGRMAEHLHHAGITRATVNVPIHLSRAIDDSPEAAAVLAERALELATNPAEQALYLVGHGPNSAEDNAAWMVNLRRLADSVRSTTEFRDVKVGVVRDDAPTLVREEAVQAVRDVIELQHALTGEPVVVVPILISRGSVSQEKIPADLAGLPVVYTGDALLPHPGLARWVEARVRETVAEASGSSN